MRLTRFVLALSLAWLGSSSSMVQAGESTLDFAAAQELAIEKNSIIVIDFFADWCGPCKAFDRDLAKAESGIKAGLSSVVFTSIDAEKGDGIELAKRYTVRAFPTYIVINADGELIDRWSGYGGPEHFLTALDGATSDTRTLAAKRESFDAEPTALLAAKFGEIALSGGNNEEAIALFEQAEQLDPSIDQSRSILSAAFGQLRSGAEGFGFDEFAAKARELALGDDANPETTIMAAQMVGALAGRFAQPEVELEFLEAALNVVETNGDAIDERSRQQIEIAGYLKVRNQPAKAVTAKKASLPEGWMETGDGLNSFAWWCFENDVNLEEAEVLARKGIDLSESGKAKAAILDTAAEICNKLGNCKDAVSLIEMAMAEDTENAYYPKQLERFRDILAESN